MDTKRTMIERQFTESASVKTKMAEMLPAEIETVGDVLIRAIRQRKKILWCGNGGSAADAQHLSTELVSRLRFNRPAIASIALTTDTSFLTAHANDFGFDDIFAREVEALGNEGDVLIGISTSGNSENIIRAMDRAKQRKITMVVLSGKDGGKLKRIADYNLSVPSRETQRIQEGHITIGHILCDLIEQELYAAEYDRNG